MKEVFSFPRSPDQGPGMNCRKYFVTTAIVLSSLLWVTVERAGSSGA
jgi:hypothetical protein